MGPTANAAPKETSLLGVPPEIRLRIFKILFANLAFESSHTSDVSYSFESSRSFELSHYWNGENGDQPRIWSYRVRGYTRSIIRVCRQLNLEAWPIFLSSIVLMLDYRTNRNPLNKLHPQIEQHVLPYLRRLTIEVLSRTEYQGGTYVQVLNRLQDNLIVKDLNRLAPSLQVLEIRAGQSPGSPVKTTRMYNAAINAVRLWCPEYKSPCSYNSYLVRIIADKIGLAGHQYFPGPIAWCKDLIIDKNRKFRVVGEFAGVEQGFVVERGFDTGRWLNVVCKTGWT